MATQEQKEQLLQLGAGMFSMALGKDNLDILENLFDGGMSINEMANILATSSVFTSQFDLEEGMMTNDQKAEVLASHYGLTNETINLNVLSEFNAVKNFFKQVLDDGLNLGEVIVVANNALTNDASVKAALPMAAAYLANATEVASYYSIDKALSGDMAQLKEALANVDSSDASVTKAKSDIDDFGSSSKTFYLTDEQDMLTGTSGDDVFVARGNSSLDNADIIDGGLGVDTVEVMLDRGETAESPLLKAIEILKVQAQAGTSASGDNDVDRQWDVEANIDAGDMRSVTQYWNEDSRADLTIEDVSRDSDQVTIGMRETDPGDVDYNVYFDEQNIQAPGGASTGGTLFLKIADLDKIQAAGNNNTALENFPYDVLNFTFNNIEYSVKINYAGVKDHDDFVVALNTALQTAENKTDGTTGDLTPFLKAAKVGTFNAVHPDGTGSYTIPVVELEKTSNSVIGDFTAGSSTWQADATIPGDTAYYSRVEDEKSEKIDALTMTNVILDRVGKDSEGGDLVIGNDSTNNVVPLDDGSGSKGIQQFNVDVDRDSWLTSMSSTNNTLEVVNVENISENQADGKGSLTLGSWDRSGNIDQFGLTDVRVFDAAGGSEKSAKMQGDITLTAQLSGDVVEKYLDLKDTATNPAEDNSEKVYFDVVDKEFSYDLGSGDDSLQLFISSDNLAKSGTGSREDFVLEINGNDGDDTINTVIGEGNGTEANNWYLNQVINSNLTVNTGKGDDTVNSFGAGNWKINTGEGNDTVYTDNIADKAQWVLNAVTNNPGNLQSEAADSVRGVNAYVTVTFRGIESRVEIADSYGKTSVQTITDLQVNQAIKQAINGNEVLNKLLVAEDGPARTLVIDSLIDGVQAEDDLQFSFSNRGLTTSQANAGLVAGDLFDSNDFANGDYDVALNTATNTPFTTAGAGADSTAVSDNVINLGKGNDVLVLGTDDDSDGGASNDTIVYKGYDNGNDTIVNFVDQNVTANGADVLDFRSYLGGAEATAAANDIAVAAGVLADNTAYELMHSNAGAAVNFSALTAARVEALLNGTGNANDSATIVAGIDATNAGSTDYVLMVENAQNVGEYKFFHLESTNNTTNFTVKLIGTADFGESQDFEGGNLA